MPLINRFYDDFRNFFAHHFPKVFAFCNRRKALVKFFISGGIAGAVDLAVLFILHGLMGWGILLATFWAFLISFVVSFSLQKLWTFRNYSHKHLPHQLIISFSAAFISLNLNGLGMHILVNNLRVWYLFSQILVNIFLSVINFLTYNIIFRQTKENENNN